MGYINYYATESAYLADKNSLPKPNVCLADDTGEVFFNEDNSNEKVITSTTNPGVMAICYAKGWAAHEDYMTAAECAAVTSLDDAFKGSAITSFDELQYFTGLTGNLYQQFVSCTALTSIIVPEGITSLSWTFRSCSNLKSVHLPNTLTSIGERAFDGCTGLETINLPSSLTSIGEWAFDDCTGLETINIPSSLTLIGGHNDKSFGVRNLTIDSGNTSFVLIGGVMYNTGKTTIYYYIDNLPSYNIEEGVTTVPEDFLDGVTTLNAITLPSTLTSIPDFTLRTRVSPSITCKATTPPSIGQQTFYSQPNILPKIYVPAASVSTYQSATNWSKFTIQAIPE